VDKVSTLDDMNALVDELNRLQAKLITDFYSVVQDFPSRKFYPNWLQQKSVANVMVSEKGKPVLDKVLAPSKRQAVVLYDLETPDLNGLEFLNILRANAEARARTKVILMSQRLAPEAKDKILQLGANALVGKPISAESLQEAFARIGLKY
jgi:CheY-like chemotaxis protein